MIVARDAVGELSSKLKSEGKKVVTCNGSFDLMHVGHVFFLGEAKKQGDVLIVCVNSDTSIKRYKGEDRPINSEQDRLDMLDALSVVDYVVLFDEDDPRSILSEICPSVHCNGEEYGEDCIEAQTIRECGGKLYLIPRKEGFSTTDLIERIKKSA